MNRSIARYGWRPDPPDHRDLLWHEHHTTIGRQRLPATVDLGPQMPPIWNQGHLGSCTGHGIARLLVYEALGQGEQLPGLSNDNAGFSRLFIYYNERAIEGTISQDTGGQIRDGIKVVAVLGAPPETDWPYSDQNPGPFQERPPAQAYADAARHKAIVYHRMLPGGGRMCSALAQAQPIVFGFAVPQFFEDGSWDPASQMLPLPGPGDGFIGGHCVVLSGYDWTCERFPVPAFQVDNSWGTGFGMGGRFWMDARYFSGLAQDLWTITRVD